MGLGLNGGGLATALFLARHGAVLTVTDTKPEEALAQPLATLAGLPIRFVLGEHRMEDFSSADLVIKNPAVRPDSPYIRAAAAVETDISLFLRFTRSPIIAVTGSKGKSSTSSAIHHCLLAAGKPALLGGNIARSPLSFIDETGPDRPVVLELSSWQLADMRGLGVLKPRIALLTSIMPDHMNRYASMEEYVADKRLIYADQDESCWTVLNRDDAWSALFAAETKGRVAWYSDRRDEASTAWLEEGPEGGHRPRGYFAGAAGAEEVLGRELLVPGAHQRKNLLGAALALRLYGLDAATVRDALAGFRGIEHRLEFFAEKDGIRWYNDSAATIPQAVGAAIESFDAPVVLITGGTDKNIDFEPSRRAYARSRLLILLAGTGTEKLRRLLDEDGVPYIGPFGELGEAVRKAAELSRPGDVVILSPGCTSFGMFLHEFDRGAQFKETVMAELARR